MGLTDDKVLQYPTPDKRRKRQVGPGVMNYRCAEYSLDTEAYTLTRNGEVRAVEPQVFDLIVFLIENRARVVTRDELLESLWHGRIVSDSAINARLKQARKALGDDGKKQSMIKTIHRRGYQFVGEVSLSSQPESIQEKPSSPPKTNNRLPSILVLQFDNLSGDPAQKYFADGIGQNIAGRLSRFRSLKVMAGHNIDSRKQSFTRLASELETDYLLTGSVQRDGERVRVNVELIDGLNGEIRWSEHFDRRGEGVMDIQDDIAGAITGSLWSYGGTIREAELENLSCKLSSDFNAFDFLLQGIHHKEQYTPEDNSIARAHFDRAIELDPHCSEALAWRAWTHIIELNMGWTDDFEATLANIYADARQAIKIGPASDIGHAALGTAYNCEQKYARGLAEYDRALEISPNSPDLMALKGAEMAASGDSEGVELTLKSFEYNKNPPSWYYWSLGMAHFFANQPQQAIQAFEKMEQQNRDTLTYLIASNANAGRLEEAQERLAELLLLDPEFDIADLSETHCYLGEETLSRLINGLNAASKAGRKLHAV